MTEREVAAELDPGRFRCLVFDWDGTLVDTRKANYLALAETLSGYDIELNEDWYDLRTGMSTDAMVEAWCAEHGHRSDLPMADLVRRRDEIFLRAVADIRPIEPVLDIARRHARRCSLAVASGGPRGVIVPVMRATGLEGLFDVIVTREDATRGKPAPEIFLVAATRLGARPADCLVYEDSDEGIQAARAAGMPAVDVRPMLAAG